MTTYYVTKAGNNTTGNGSQALPWLTIDKALQTISIAGGHTILVGAGTYAENSGTGRLKLDRTFLATVTISPDAGAAVIITGTGTGDSFLINSGATNYTFDGLNTGGASLTIQQAGSDAVTINFLVNATGIANITFRNCTITNSIAAGIAVAITGIAATGITFDTCTITSSGTGNAIGVSMYGKAALWLMTVALTNCIVSGTQYGVRLFANGRIDGLTITGGTYTATGLATGDAIGLRNQAFSGPIQNITISGVTCRGNGRGIELSGGASAAITTLAITNCDVDATANKQIGMLLGAFIAGLTVSGGTYIGGEAATGSGGIYVLGPSTTNVQFLNASIGSAAPDPVTNRVLALGIEGTDGIVVRGCFFYGNGRGVTLQDNTANALIENNYSIAEDMGCRIGHDAAGAYACNSVIIRNNTFLSLITVGLIVGEGVTNVTIERNIIRGGPGIVRLRGATSNSNIVIQDNTLYHDPAFAGTRTAAFECYGARNATIQRNMIISRAPYTFVANLEAALVNQSLTIVSNRIRQYGGALYNWPSANAGSGNVIDLNRWLLRGATFGIVLATSGITTIPALRAAWGSANDGLSRPEARAIVVAP